MKDGLYYIYRVVQTSGYVLWDDQLTSNVLGNNKQDPEGYD